MEFNVEATTVAPSQAGPLADHPNPKTSDEMKEFLEGYMPLKFGSSLMSKVNKTDANGKHYWERQETAGKPFVIAIADFHKQAEQDELVSIATFTQSALWPYLYGRRMEWKIVHGRLVVRLSKNSFTQLPREDCAVRFFRSTGSGTCVGDSFFQCWNDR